MSSSCKPNRGRRCKPANKYGPLVTARSEAVRQKLENIQDYQPLKPQDMKEKIRDLTEMKRLSDWFDNEEGKYTDMVRVSIYFSPPTRTSKIADNRGDTSSLRSNFEQFCEWGLNSEASLKINDTILKWDATGLVEPHREALYDNSCGAAASAQYSRLGGNGHHFISLGVSNRLNQLLNLIIMYNERYTFHPLNRNSRTFVCEALQVLGLEFPQNLKLFEDYRRRIKSLRSCHTQSIPEIFDNHAELESCIKHNLRTAITNTYDIEYLYYLCILNHVIFLRRNAMRTNNSALKEYSEVQVCPHELETAIYQVQDKLFFNQCWFQLSAFQA